MYCESQFKKGETMKKWSNLFLAFILSLSMALFAGVGSVFADGTVPPASGGANPQWVWVNPQVPATIIPASEITTAPPAWQQLLSTGLDITGPATICYPSRGAQFGWTGQIRLLFEGKWIPITTKFEWVPDSEGVLMACANARYAGIYALFGYWQPVE